MSYKRISHLTTAEIKQLLDEKNWRCDKCGKQLSREVCLSQTKIPNAPIRALCKPCSAATDAAVDTIQTALRPYLRD